MAIGIGTISHNREGAALARIKQWIRDMKCYFLTASQQLHSKWQKHAHASLQASRFCVNAAEMHAPSCPSDLLCVTPPSVKQTHTPAALCNRPRAQERDWVSDVTWQLCFISTDLTPCSLLLLHTTGPEMSRTQNTNKNEKKQRAENCQTLKWQ